ncbi:MAG TPA: alpha/beta fold hydrolase [Candidatus Nitrosocosmicus sp.]|nr:alpha/beta fold hydrolase [Candidatus Nitrosocosmicus sp.]
MAESDTGSQEKPNDELLTEKFVDDYLTILDRQPSELKTSVPVLLSLGWGETPKVFEDVMSVLTENQRRVLALSYTGTRNVDVESSFPDIDVGKPIIANADLDEKYPDIEVGKAMAMLQMMEEKGIEQADIIAHSGGAISVLIAASLNPEKFRNIVLANPAGLIGKDTFPRLVKGLTMQSLRDTMRLLSTDPAKKNVLRLFKEVGKFVFRHPIQGLKEGIAISNSDIYSLIKELKEADNSSIKISIMAGVEDEIFPMQEYQDTLEKGVLDGFLSMKGGHNELHLQPVFTRSAEELLSQMEKSRTTKLESEK